MIIRPTARSAACVLSLALIGTLIAASVRIAPLPQEIADPQEIAAAPLGVEMDISTLATTVNTANLPLLSVRDPI
ncbi:MAG: hypothetical protein JO084_06310 [Bradyrhizobiaceae bacterium]|nr:hypothetical protein [Bradyrhizobiaceae bacterium]